MIRSAVTISLVAEARGGPFVYWDDLPGSVAKAAQLGYDAVELFAPSADAVDTQGLARQLDETGLKVAAVGTGAGWVVRKLSLTAAAPEERQKALRFVESIIDLGAPFGAPAIIGSMQGRWGEAGKREAVLDRLRGALSSLASYAAERNVPLLYEPLNRYETNLCNTLADGVELIESLSTHNVKLLADLFHMNIEETDIATALRDAGEHVGHVHFVDSNRRPAGCGHLDFEPIAAVLREMNFAGYASAEAFPWPDSDAAAQQTIDAFRRCFRQ